MRRTIVLRGRRVDYELERKRIRHVNLRIRGDGSIHVSAPRLTPLRAVEELLRAREDWIFTHLRRREEAAAREKDAVWLWGEKLPIRREQGTKSAAAREGGALILTMKDPTDAEEERCLRERWQKQICAERVTALCRLYYPAFAPRIGSFPTLSFRRMTSRWGSCRPQKGALSFNTRLAELPPGCADYVVVHELAHFLQPNHSAAFYAEVARVLPDWETRRAQIRAWEKAHPL